MYEPKHLERKHRRRAAAFIFVGLALTAVLGVFTASFFGLTHALTQYSAPLYSAVLWQRAESLPPPEELTARLLTDESLGLYTAETVTWAQEVPPPIERRLTDTLLLGEWVVLQEGTPGLMAYTDKVYRRDGVEQRRESLSSVLLAAPTPTVVGVGTAEGTAGAAGRFLWPCEGEITSPFGERFLFGTWGFHTGIDIALPAGNPIAAAADGVVTWAGEKGTYGNLVVIDHGNGFTTFYAHASALLAEVGQAVRQGETVALVGSTGRSTGPHCHFEIRWLDTPLDPQECLP